MTTVCPSREGSRAGIPLRRGFALPLVLLLGLVAVLSTGIMLSQQSRLAITEKNEVKTYQFHHAQQGLAEIAELVLSQQAFRPGAAGRRPGGGGAAGAANAGNDPSASERLAAERDPDPVIRFSIRVAGDASVLRFELRDAQGTALYDPTGGSGEVMRQVALEMSRAADPSRFLRQRGPAQVNINTAPVEVLAKLFEHGAPGTDGASTARAIVEAREESRLNAADLRAQLQRAGVDEKFLDVFTGYTDETAKPRKEYAGLVVAEPSLYSMRAIVEDGGGRVVQRYRALVLYSEAGRSGSAGPVQRSRPAFLEWTEIVDPPSG